MLHSGKGLARLMRTALGNSWPARHSMPSIGGQLHTGSATLMPDVSVPPLGESVSEGTISALLKKQGDSVKTDEVVAQLETDKVTIDCKSPHTGLISQLLVKVGDVVKPGTVLCVVGEGAGASAPAPGPTPTASSQPASSSAAPASSSSSSSQRTPMIHFPLRHLPDGRRISDLTPSEADAASAGSEDEPAPTHVPPHTLHVEVPPAASKPVAPAKAAQYASQEPPRRIITQREIDLINMGGAF